MDSAVSFPENWKAPRELATAVPRETQLTGRGIFVYILAVALPIIAAGVGYAFHRQNVEANAQNTLLRTEGRETSAEIVRLWRTSGKSPEDRVRYAFSADHAWIHGECAVPSRYWQGLQKAGFLPVRYLPSNPAMNHPAAWENSTVPIWMMAAFPAIPIALSIFLFWTLARRKKLAAEGLAAPAVITKSFRVKSSYATRFQFRTKEGAVVAGSDQIERRIEPGTSVCVIYLPENPRRNAIYPQSLYRVQP